MARIPLALVILSAALAWPAPRAQAGDPAAPRLKVLFLGDKGHHDPADRAAQIKPVLASRGLDVDYTERMEDLNPETLGRYDALLVYANTTRIAPDQEKALLNYVEGGGGFAPIHCASYCFLNSPRYIALVGAQFLRHGTGVFEVKAVEPAHPIMKGLALFRTWDETYVHHKHNEKDRTVLETRAEGAGAEPWTWVRTQGKGRVFYTAYGHDARTWQEPGFHDLLERGIRWAANKGPVLDSRPRVAAGAPAFSYESAPADIPNYLPGRQWGTQGDAIKRMQKPLSPADSRKHLVVPGGFEPQLFAAEPEIKKPICMTWDHRGRLYIAESVDYPNMKGRSGAPGRDRITILEDTDGDGRADSFKVFALGLNIPTSLVYANGGLIVLQAPDTLFLKDEDGDDKADTRKVLFTGWGTGDTHAGPSNLRYGFDNWIWGIVGYSAFRGTVGGERHQFGQGLFRFKPDGSKLEFLRSTTNNSWGVGFSEDGLVFGSTANGCPSVYLPVPNRFYEMVRGLAPRALQSITATNQFYPITDQVRQVDFHGGFTAAAGHALYTARAYPREYWNQTAFVTEPTGHLAATFTLERKGADVAAYYGWNLLASDDEWTAPIAAEVGPDGQVWVIDWYNYIVQHNPTPHGFKTGRGSAYETPLRDQTHGRIYRVVYKGSPKSSAPRLDPARPDSLASALASDNQFWRMHAQRLLVERGHGDVLPALADLVKNRAVDAIGLNVGAIHALCALAGLAGAPGGEPALRAAALGALGHPSAGVRAMALRVLPRDEKAAERIARANLLDDPDAQVRLAACLALAESAPSATAAAALAQALVHGFARGDRVLADAATAAAARNDFEFLKIVAHPSNGRLDGETRLVLARVAEHWARGAPVDRAPALLAALSQGDPAIASVIVTGLAKGWPKDHPVALDRGGEDALVKLSTGLDPEARGRLVRLVGLWGNQSLDRIGAEMARTLLTLVQDAAQSDAKRIDAGRQLVELRAWDDALAQSILEQVGPRTSPALSVGLVEAVGAGKAPGAGKALAALISTLAPAARAAAIKALLTRAEWTGSLMTALEQNQVRLAELDLDQKQALAAHPDRAIARRARRIMAQGGGLPDPDRARVIEALAAQVSTGGDPARGKVVFKEQCAKCHRHGTEGGQVGPDLTGSAALPRNELLIHILDPSRSVEGNFVQYSVATTDGRVLAGLLAAETRTAIELLDAEGKRQTILRDDIDQMTASKKSLMPEGFEKQIPAADLNHLLAFLTQRGKYLPLDIRKAATIVSTRGMFNDADSEAERMVLADWSTKTVAGVPFVLVDPQGDRVPNVILLHAPQGEFPPRMPKSVELPCHAQARAVHLLSGVSGWGFPYGRKGTVSLIVRFHYTDGSVEDHPLENGVQFADYIRVVDVPGSTLAFTLKGRQQVRYLRIEPKKRDSIDRIEFVKGPDRSAPVVMAVTVELAGGE